MEHVMYTARLDLPTGPAGVHVGRVAAKLLLHGWGVTDNDLLDRVELITCELVSNAVRHAGGPSALELVLDDVSITTAVTDPSPVHPAFRSAIDHGGGHGLSIIEAMSTRWGSQIVLTGKRVWARVDRDFDHIP